MNPDRTRQILKNVTLPLFAAASILFFLLAALEYLRPGFVALFLDMRIFAGLAAVLCIASVLLNGNEEKRWGWEKVFTALVIVFAIYVIISASLPFGRLGLLVIALSIAVILVFLLNLKPKS